MNTVVTLVDTLYDAVIIFSLRIVHAYVYADKEVFIKEVSKTEIPIFEAIAEVDTTYSEIQKKPYMRGMVMYVESRNVPLYMNPTIEFDSAIACIPFGSLVIAGKPKGRFYPVMWGEKSGWVLRNDLVDRAIHIYPVFTVGQENGVDTQNTIQVRALIGDPFSLSRSEFHLQAGEYVLYRLWRRGKKILWPKIYSRVPGNWHKILKGIQGVHIRMTPKVGSLMEYINEEEIGYIAYVDAVFPDETISISEVNNPDLGIYTERTLTKDAWKEFRPVFIEVI